jgi:hypothetical protein
MSRGGIRGINNILNTGRLFLKSTPIGATTVMVSVMTRIFIIGTIVARAKGGRKDFMVAQLKDPNLRHEGLALVK